jgi:hypothetical protein
LRNNKQKLAQNATGIKILPSFITTRDDLMEKTTFAKRVEKSSTMQTIKSALRVLLDNYDYLICLSISFYFMAGMPPIL